MIARAGHRGDLLLDQHRRGAGRVERQEGLAPLPRPLVDQIDLDAHLGQNDSRTKRECGQNG